MLCQKEVVKYQKHWFFINKLTVVKCQKHWISTQKLPLQYPLGLTEPQIIEIAPDIYLLM